MSARVLVVAPHPDDESIGCGGAICLHRQRADEVRVVFLTSGERGVPDTPPDEARALREAEAAAALAVLGVTGADFLRLPDLGLSADPAGAAGRLAEILLARRPDLVYLPHPDEAHPDHAATPAVVRAALARIGRTAPLPELRAYEVWTPMTDHGWAEDISAVMRQKVRAVRCYRSQLRTFAYDRAVRGLNGYRGCLAARCRYAEVFRYLEPQAVPAGVLS
jgi:LmbE family N-acetylglucosaminyl deacetylase